MFWDQPQNGRYFCRAKDDRGFAVSLRAGCVMLKHNLRAILLAAFPVSRTTMLHPGYAIRCLLVQLLLAASAVGWGRGVNAAELQIDRDNIAIDASATVRPGRY